MKNPSKSVIMRTVIISAAGLITLTMIVVFLIYQSMLKDTDTLVTYVESVYRGEVSSEILHNTCFERFNITEERPETEKVDIKIKTAFTWHNFQRGYIWVYEDCHATDSDGFTTYGSEAFYRWKIEKINNEWSITEIYSPIGVRWYNLPKFILTGDI